jgi:putative tricarboxylic transport membrane protein
MSDEVNALADEPQRAANGNSLTAVVMPALLAAFSFWASTHSTTPGVVWLLRGAGVVLIISAALVALYSLRIANVTGLHGAGKGTASIVMSGLRVTNPQDYYGGLALIGLALFAYWASSDLSGMRGFSFGPGTAPRLFAGILLVLGVAVTLVGLFVEGAHLERYAIRGPLMVTIAILLFAALIRPVGLIISSFLVFMVASAGAKDVRWFEAVLAAVALTAFCTFLFPYALGLPFQLWPRFY